jgi:hypothetical protein
MRIRIVSAMPFNIDNAALTYKAFPVIHLLLCSPLKRSTAPKIDQTRNQN